MVTAITRCLYIISKYGCRVNMFLQKNTTYCGKFFKIQKNKRYVDFTLFCIKCCFLALNQVVKRFFGLNCNENFTEGYKNVSTKSIIHNFYNICYKKYYFHYITHNILCFSFLLFNLYIFCSESRRNYYFLLIVFALCFMLSYRC